MMKFPDDAYGEQAWPLAKIFEDAEAACDAGSKASGSDTR